MDCFMDCVVPTAWLQSPGGAGLHSVPMSTHVQRARNPNIPGAPAQCFPRPCFRLGLGLLVLLDTTGWLQSPSLCRLAVCQCATDPQPQHPGSCSCPVFLFPRFCLSVGAAGGHALYRLGGCECVYSFPHHRSSCSWAWSSVVSKATRCDTSGSQV